MAADSSTPLTELPPEASPLPGANGSYLGQVRPKAITQEIEDSYIDYAMSVIVSRALPDVRDGLKPVQRRILYAMYADLALRPGSAYKKSARVVGEVLGKYHPHGDLAVYHAMARMVQDFSLRYPLIDGQGNFGSVDGDNPAAMRYTEARLAALTSLMLDDIDKDTVDWQPNFDDSLQQPTVLPSLVPNLLINGTSGIAVGMATNIPPLNLGEVVDALNFVLDHWEQRNAIPLKALMARVKGPDFPTGGQILGTAGIRDAFAFGHGRIVVRSEAQTEEMPSGNRYRLVFTSIPYLSNKAELIARIAALVRQGDRIRGISDMRDESDRNGIRIVMDLKAGEVPERVLNQLYRHSDLQISFSVNFRALVGNRPVRLGLGEALIHHLDHCIEVVTRRTRYLLAQVTARAHILEGLLLAITHIERVIHVIRASESAAAAGEILVAELAFSDRQIQAILDMPLRRLAGLEQQRITEEYQDIQEKVVYYQGLLDDPRQIRHVIQTELAALKDQFNDPRRTEILFGISADVSDEDLVIKQDDLISFWASHNIRRTLAADFSVRGRGGVGVIGKSDREEAPLSQALFANSLDTILFLSNRGRLYTSKVYNLPVAPRTAKGTTVRGAISMELADEMPDTCTCVPAGSSFRSLILVTRRGRIKRMRWALFQKLTVRGKRAITLLPGDTVAQAILTDGTSDVLLVSRMGKALRLDETVLRYQGSTASGVIGMRLQPGDSVAGCVRIPEAGTILVVYARGKGKRIDASCLRTQGRGGQGVWIVPSWKRAEMGYIASVMVVDDSSEIAIVSANSMVARIPAASISVLSRYAAGIKLMGLSEGDFVADTALLPLSPPDEDAEDPGTAEAEPETAAPLPQ